MSEIVGDSVLILGYGREGKSLNRFLNKYYPKIEIGVADKKKSVPIADKSIKLHLGENYLDHIYKYDTIIRSPGIPFKLPQIQKCIKEGKKVTSATNIFFSQNKRKTIGVTGTKGKSTTASLIKDILKSKYSDVRLAGNIGKPVLSYLGNTSNQTIYVIELSSYQLEDLHYNPDIAVLLRIFPEHLDKHGSYRDYITAKENILRHQKSSDYIVYNASNKIVENIVGKSKAKKYSFSITKVRNVDCFQKEGQVYAYNKKRKTKAIMRIKDIPLLGLGNLENVLAAVSVGVLMDISSAKIKTAVSLFKPLKHRLEFVGKYRGIRFYNDSLATIPEATISAIEALGNNVETLIAGGYDRGLNYSNLGDFLSKSRIKTLILLPDTGMKIWRAIISANINKNLQPRKYEVSNMEEAVRIAYKKTQQGKICLLSPASSSFNLFRDYEERGNIFKNLVLNFGKN